VDALVHGITNLKQAAQPAQISTITELLRKRAEALKTMESA
jgi:hypothetical protein